MGESVDCIEKLGPERLDLEQTLQSHVQKAVLVPISVLEAETLPQTQVVSRGFVLANLLFLLRRGFVNSLFVGAFCIEAKWLPIPNDGSSLNIHETVVWVF